MDDLSWVKKQGEFAGQLKRKFRQQNRLTPKEKMDWFADAYECFEQKMKESEPVFRKKRMDEKIKLQERIRSLNRLKDKP